MKKVNIKLSLLPQSVVSTVVYFCSISDKNIERCDDNIFFSSSQ